VKAKIQNHKKLNTHAQLIAAQLIADTFVSIAVVAMESGFSIRSLDRHLRIALVKAARDQQSAEAPRVSVSGISLATGIPRRHVADILSSSLAGEATYGNKSENVANRILRNWHENQRFMDVYGRPMDLPIFGKGASFESLAKKYARSAPVRALVDELVRIQAVEILPNQRIRAKTKVAVFRGMNIGTLESLYQRTTELISTIAHNVRNPDRPRLVANATLNDFRTSDLPVIRKEISDRAAILLADLHSYSGAAKARRVIRKTDEMMQSSSRVSVTIYMAEGSDNQNKGHHIWQPRKNFSRKKQLNTAS
jgi:Family of unknown function (DUF6502)